MYGQIPFNSALNMAGKTSLLSKINFSSILTNTQKVLNVINQAVPLYYQAKPIFNNIKSINKIGKEFFNTKTQNTTINNNNVVNNKNYNNMPEPVFFL